MKLDTASIGYPKTCDCIAESPYESATVLFADIVGFTALSASITPEKLVRILNSLFSRFDAAAAQCGVVKVKTIGDAYMAVAGVPDFTGVRTRS